jgi:hypothetical protein
MSTLERDELLTQSEILKKETSPLTKEADQHCEARARRSETWSGFITQWRWDGSSYVIDLTAGWSFGEPQVYSSLSFWAVAI